MIWKSLESSISNFVYASLFTRTITHLMEKNPANVITFFIAKLVSEKLHGMVNFKANIKLIYVFII